MLKPPRNKAIVITHTHWQPICQRSDLIRDSGVCALWENMSTYKERKACTLSKKSIALFFLPGQAQQLYAIDNWDPIAQAGIIARGILAEVEGELTIASPLFKHHFRLADGLCVENSSIQLATYPLTFFGNTVFIGSNSIQ
ncbi:nitrite reductase small subunit NirD [Microbulbifer sp. 2205BS26-8]